MFFFLVQWAAGFNKSNGETEQTKHRICTYVLHSEPLGAVSSNICVTLVLIRKNAFVSTADTRTSIRLIFDIGLNRPSMLLPSAAPAPGLLWNLRMYLSSWSRKIKTNEKTFTAAGTSIRQIVTCFWSSTIIFSNNSPCNCTLGFFFIISGPSCNSLCWVKSTFWNLYRRCD